MIGEIRQNFTEASASVGLILATALSRGTKPANWDANVALGQDKQRKLPFKMMHAFCWSCSNASFASQYTHFHPHEWKPAKG